MKTYLSNVYSEKMNGIVIIYSNFLPGQFYVIKFVIEFPRVWTSVG